MAKIKTSNEDKKDSTIKDLISHVSRIETSLDGILSTVKDNKNKQNPVSSDNKSEEMGTILSKMDNTLDSLNDYNRKVLDILGQIRNTLEKNSKSDLKTEKAMKEGKGGLFSKWFGKGKDESKPEEQYGSIEKRDEKTKLLEKIAGNTAFKQKEEKEEKKEEKGGLLSKILGFAGKLLLPMLAGLLLSGLKPLVKNLISGLFGDEGILGDIGDFVGGAVADMLPGAVAGYLLTKTWRGALIGATISYGWERLKDIFRDITGMMNGEPREGAGELKGYEEKALAGALAGASLTGWKKGSFKAAVFGAGIGIAVEWILNRANEVRAMLEGESVEIKTIPGTGISEALAGGMIGGAVIGHGVGGWKGAAWGAAIGAIAGAVATVATDFNNRLQDAKEGHYTEPAEILGIPYPIFTGIIAGAAIGGKFGGLVGGVIGAAVGGIAGAIYNWGSNVFMSTKAQQKNGQDYKDKHMKDNKILQGVKAEEEDLNSQINSISEEKAAIKAKMKSGEISQAEGLTRLSELEAKRGQLKDKKGKLEDFDYESNKRVADAFTGKKKKDGTVKQDPMDTNGDGIITQAELDVFKDKYGGLFASMGGTGRSIRRVQSLLDANGGAGVTKDQLIEASAKHNNLDTENLPTVSQINSEKLAKQQVQNSKESNESLKELIEVEKENGEKMIAAINKPIGEEDEDGAYANITASGSGVRKTK